MKNILSENMLRFGTKNLSGRAKRELVVKSIMETINQHGVGNDIRRKLSEQQTAGSSVPSSITINYDNGMLRFNQFFKNGDLVWDTNAIFKGSSGTPGTLTLTEITFVPSFEAPPGTAAVAVPLVKPFSVTCPIEAGGASGSTWEALQNSWSAGIKLNTKSTQMATVLAACDPSKGNAQTIESLNMVIGANILDALYAYCGKEGWYTGPKKDVATMYAIFTGHDGRSTNI
jgi:hypothetical protein